MAIVEGKLQLRNSSAAALELQYDASNLMSFTVGSGGAVTVAGTWADLGTVTTADINGGTLDGVVIGGASAAAATVTTLTASSYLQGTTGNGYLDLRGDSGASNGVRLEDSGALTVDAAGPHAFGDSTAGFKVGFHVGGAYTAAGAGNLSGFRISQDLTAGGGGTGVQMFSVGQVTGGSVTTQDSSITYSMIATAYFDEPDITKGASDTITAAATVYVEAAPSEGTNNYALFVDAGRSRFDGDGTHVFELPADASDPTGGGGAATGRIPVKIGGSTYYLAYY